MFIKNKDKTVLFSKGKEYWHVKKVAEWLGISQQTVKKRAIKHEICSYRFIGMLSGNPNYYLKEDVDRMPGKYGRNFS